jgi:hypothetical protein
MLVPFGFFMLNTHTPRYVSGDKKVTERVVEKRVQDIK